MRNGMSLLMRSALSCRNVATKKAANSGVLAADLYQDPSKWKSLKPDQIFELYRERLVKLAWH